MKENAILGYDPYSLKYLNYKFLKHLSKPRETYCIKQILFVSILELITVEGNQYNVRF